MGLKADISLLGQANFIKLSWIFDIAPSLQLKLHERQLSGNNWSI